MYIYICAFQLDRTRFTCNFRNAMSFITVDVTELCKEAAHQVGLQSKHAVDDYSVHVFAASV